MEWKLFRNLAHLLRIRQQCWTFFMLAHDYDACVIKSSPGIHFRREFMLARYRWRKCMTEIECSARAILPYEAWNVSYVLTVDMATCDHSSEAIFERRLVVSTCNSEWKSEKSRFTLSASRARQMMIELGVWKGQRANILTSCALCIVSNVTFFSPSDDEARRSTWKHIFHIL